MDKVRIGSLVKYNPPDLSSVIIGRIESKDSNEIKINAQTPHSITNSSVATLTVKAENFDRIIVIEYNFYLINIFRKEI